LLEEIHKQIQNCVSKPAPRLSELVTSSIGWIIYLFYLKLFCFWNSIRAS
jgi:hypothetical protein